mmetsp:Transcript_24023/g.42380  ORF Transcript_24023/g.42380 Transcript_24023/m.42380 type:complete len:272 (+) Transcript_24023:1429-2244(+)
MTLMLVLTLIPMPILTRRPRVLREVRQRRNDERWRKPKSLLKSKLFLKMTDPHKAWRTMSVSCWDRPTLRCFGFNTWRFRPRRPKLTLPGLSQSVRCKRLTFERRMRSRTSGLLSYSSSTNTAPLMRSRRLSSVCFRPFMPSTRTCALQICTRPEASWTRRKRLFARRASPRREPAKQYGSNELSSSLTTETWRAPAQCCSMPSKACRPPSMCFCILHLPASSTLPLRRGAPSSVGARCAKSSSPELPNEMTCGTSTLTWKLSMAAVTCSV